MVKKYYICDVCGGAADCPFVGAMTRFEVHSELVCTSKGHRRKGIKRRRRLRADVCPACLEHLRAAASRAAAGVLDE